MIEPTKDGFKLSTGKEVYANGCLVSIGIDEDGSDPFHFGEGYDGGFTVYNPEWNWDASPYLTVPEGIEVCKAMLKAWSIRLTALEKLL